MKYFTLISILLSFSGFSQISIHEQQLNEYNELGLDASYYESLPRTITNQEKVGCNLEKVVYGWHPYWVGSAYLNYQWDLLSHFSYFSYEVNAADGEAITTHSWNTSAAVDAALNSGNTKVTLCVTLFSGHSTFFGSAAAQQTLITNLINLIQSRGAHGVNIDFEGLPASQTTNFANFMVDLANQMHSAIPNSEVSTVLYAVDWNNVFDFSIMEPAVDHYIIMGYAYYYSGSSTAGPTDPLYHFGSTYNYTLSKSVTYYLDEGCPNEKLVLGLPYYGYEWPTSSLTVPSSTTGSGSAKTYTQVMTNSSGYYSAGNHQWEGDAISDVFAFNNGSNRQCFMSLDSAFRKRLDHVNKTGIAGIGIWALGYDDGYNELWNGIEDYLTDCYSDPCSGSFHDFGGPTKNYYNDEDYTWTIAPQDAVSLDFDFSMFDLELNWDYLYVYDGPDVTAPQIPGSPFTGTNGPGLFSSTSGSMTFRFTSDISTVKAGFLASYSCIQQVAPVASFNVSSSTVCLGDSILLMSNSTDADSLSWSTTSGTLSSLIADSTYLIPTVSGNIDVTLEVFNSAGDDAVSQSLNVTVVNPPSAALSLSSSTITIPDAIMWFSNESSDAVDYYWYFGDGTYSTDSEPWHEYLSTGLFDGYLIASNSPCSPDTAYFQVSVGYAGINELTDNLGVSPNPFNSTLTVSRIEGIETIYITDFSGRKLEVEYQSSEKGWVFNTDNLAAGSYYLILVGNDFSKSVPLIKL